MKTKTPKPLWKDDKSRIYMDAQDVLHATICGKDFVPAPCEYEGFTARDFAELYVELTNSGIPAIVAARWVNQAQGFNV